MSPKRSRIRFAHIPVIHPVAKLRGDIPKLPSAVKSTDRTIAIFSLEPDIIDAANNWMGFEGIDMELRFALSGSVIFSTEADCVPPVGSKVSIRTTSYKKGLTVGSLIEFIVSEEWPNHYDYSQGTPIVFIDVNKWEVLEAGPSPD